VGVLFVGARRAWRQLAAAEAYRDVARHLGLLVDTRGLSVQGTVRERRLWIGQVMVGYGSERRRRVRGVLGLRRPLGLGLLMRPLNTRARLRRRSRRMRVGMAALDKRYEFHGDEVDRVQALFGDEAVQAALAELATRWPRVLITDHFVRVSLLRPESTVEDLHALVSALERLAAAVEDARSRIPAPTRLRSTAEAWEPIAAALGLAFEPSLPAMAGERDGRAVLLSARRGADGYSATLQASLRLGEELGLQLRPQVEPDGYWSVGQDIQLGEPAFDRAFVVKGWDPDGVRERLSAPARLKLLELAQYGALQADDGILTVHDVPLDGLAIPAILELLTSTAAALEA